ncbi:hypothetical protein PCANC_27194 [Puccinia coronata f. sp. avenae]|uniref:DNA 3'-5' helicase n=1 Tax=Puccinia coronata f. sp. avenae TaxID=200324 RepID=A0A2N5RW97_9BASI|nr:hypothetical protein PCANC_27194 [Puccinia coronata f. sp. avenae]PLW35935.1 hypothetical protein PCASD_12693 [Puccinia coronata f. sp. avenae]
MSDTDLRKSIISDCLPCYPKNEPPKTVQVDAVMSLVRQRHTFVMAGTGCGKSRISEMYHHLFARSKKAVILVLNPLDALGDNQVNEKVAQGYTAVNLKKLNFNKSVAAEILRRKYNFVYLSPEIFLNNETFTKIYHHHKFQNQLALLVVDEAHMIYSWGLVKNGEAKRSSSHKRTQDQAVFQPSYGDLGRALGSPEKTPILFFSATCCPLAITEILKSLKIAEKSIDFVCAELTRPEIRIVRYPMRSSLKSVNDVLPMFGKIEEVESKDIVPTLIYSGARNTTLQVMKVVNQAHNTGGGEYNPDSALIQRYHACTGDMDKEDVISGFEHGDFLCISCTMALGLGQNWKRVRRVIHIGRGDLSCICQMIGRCGCDGRDGLAVLLVEPKRKFGLNTPEAIQKANKLSNDTRMDSLAITPVCLQIAISVDNLSVLLTPTEFVVIEEVLTAIGF